MPGGPGNILLVHSVHTCQPPHRGRLGLVPLDQSIHAIVEFDLVITVQCRHKHYVDVGSGL